MAARAHPARVPYTPPVPRSQLPAEQASLAVGGRTIDYTVVRSHQRLRTLEISVRPGEGVRVAVPAFVPSGEAAALVRRRAAWILARLDAFPPPPPAIAPGSRVPYRGGFVRLAFVPDGRASLRGDELTLPLAHGADPSAMEAALTAWYRARAAVLVPDAVAEWAARMGLAPRKVLVRDQKRRWGSCAADGTLRFNWRLVLAPPAALDYVAVHELAHLRHRDHSRAFWDEVTRWLPDWKERRTHLTEVALGQVHA